MAASDYFTCRGCNASCCRTLSQGDLSLLKDVVLSNPYEVLLTPAVGLQLFEWELEGLQDEANKGGLGELNIKPLKGVVDGKRKVTLVTAWILEADVCPFLDGAASICRIHRTRPMMCRAYPLKATGVYETLEGKHPKIVMGECLKHQVTSLLDESTPYYQFMNFFGDLYWYCFQMEQAKIWIDSLVRGLVDSQFITVGNNPSETKLYGLLEFMQQNVLLRSKTVEDKLNLFQDIEFAKRAFGELVVQTV